VLWLAHVRTGRVQAINELPERGGGIRVILGPDSRPTGLYTVVPKRDWGLFDGQLHTVHRSSCGNATGRRLMAQRDGEHDDLDETPAVVPCAEPRCPYPLPEVDLAAGERFHAACDPRFRDRYRDHPFWTGGDA
jgi:hypothetical protein